MNIDFVTNVGDLNNTGGYGIAGHGVVSSLNQLGHGVAMIPFMPSCSDIQLNFCFPSYFADYITRDRYNIYLSVWESTRLQPDWYEIVNEMDEIWTASSWCKWMLEDNGYKVDNIYSHGIDSIWKPRRRKINNKVRFLHDGEPTARKNGQMAFDAFKVAFGDQDDVELILKAKGSSGIRQYDRWHSIVGTANTKNTKLITDVYEETVEMVSLYHKVHCLVMPTAGEGFGLPGLQAISTGMPALATEECAPYVDYLGGLGLKSKYIDSPWPSMHPGQILEPNFDDLVDKYRYVYDNAESLLSTFHKQSFAVHEEYDWIKLTEKAFGKLAKRDLSTSNNGII